MLRTKGRAEGGVLDATAGREGGVGRGGGRVKVGKGGSGDYRYA